MQSKLYLFKTLASALLVALLVASCRKDKEDNARQVSYFSAEIALKWNQMYLEIERYANGYRPGPAPRSLAYLGLSAYEATVSGMNGYKSLRHLYTGLNIPPVEKGKTYHWPLVVHYSYATLMHKFFPNVEKNLESRMLAMENEMDGKYKFDVSKDVYDRSVAYGRAVATAVWEWSATDKVGHDYYKDPFGDYSWQANYKKPGDWVPTVPGPGKPMFPFWGKARTFAITEAEKLCQPPIPYSEKTNSALYAQGLEVYNAIKDENWKDGQWIAFFWSDDLVNLTFSPGPRWIAIANQVITTKKSDLQTALVCYAKLGMALNDAAVACWHSKYFYNFERPESYIKRLIDPNWEPTLKNPLTGDVGMTPSFPAYPSGHSTMGGAGAEVLTEVFGNNFGMYDDCHKGRTEFNGTPRYFNNFYEMAEENAISRVPLGVHWRMDCRVGVDLGYFCGRRVNKLPWR
jgi:membrane-associated phospholipid phosphatase